MIYSVGTPFFIYFRVFVYKGIGKEVSAYCEYAQGENI